MQDIQMDMQTPPMISDVDIHDFVSGLASAATTSAAAAAAAAAWSSDNLLLGLHYH
jgi:hypothetical protein